MTAVVVSLLVPALALALQSAGTPAPYLLSTPAVKGNTVVFSYAGDLYVSSTEPNSLARRLTSDPGIETNPEISPDGKTVAFLGGYEGGAEVYTIPIEGGEPRRLTYEAGNKALFGFTPDGKSVAYGSAARNFTNRQPALYLAPVAGGPAKDTVIKEAAELSYFPDGNRVAYVRYGSVNFNWRRYRGGSQGKVSIYDFRTNSYSELPAGREQSYSPMATRDAVYYLSDRANGTLNLYRYDLASKRDEALTKFTDVDVRSPSSDGNTIAYERDGRLYLYDIAGKRTTDFAPRIISEELPSRPTVKPLTPYIESATATDTGGRAYVEARGEIFSVSAKTGETINLTNSSGARDRAPLLSPDGLTSVLPERPREGGRRPRLRRVRPRSHEGHRARPEHHRPPARLDESLARRQDARHPLPEGRPHARHRRHRRAPHPRPGLRRHRRLRLLPRLEARRLHRHRRERLRARDDGPRRAGSRQGAHRWALRRQGGGLRPGGHVPLHHERPRDRPDLWKLRVLAEGRGRDPDLRDAAVREDREPAGRD